MNLSIDPMTGMPQFSEEQKERFSISGSIPQFVTGGSSLPSTGAREYQLFVNTSDGTLYAWHSNAWHAMTGGGSTPSTAGQPYGLLLALTKPA